MTDAVIVTVMRVPNSSFMGSFTSILAPSLAAVAIALGVLASPVHADPCKVDGAPKFGGEAPMIIDADCVDPDYNEKTFVIDSSSALSLTLPDGSSIPYTEVRGHFPATRTPNLLPAGVTGSPTTASHSVTWRFPARAYWRNRFFQQSYPLPIENLNTVDSRFAFTNGAYTVGVIPGNTVAGYRVIAGAAKLARAYANQLYGNDAPVHGFIYGQSGGSVQMMAANEATTGVWDGIVPVVIATDGLTMHSFQWGGLYALTVPYAKRKAISEASAPGSGRDIYAGLTPDERAGLDELLNAGFARKALEGWDFSVAGATTLSGALAKFDPSYEDDFWSKPGYEGANPPDFLHAAKVDGFAVVQSVERKADNSITAVNFEPGTVPPLGTVGTEGLQFYVYATDGVTRIVDVEAQGLSGELSGSRLKLNESNSPLLLSALTVGAKIRINNRFVLAACFYPRHSILDNGNPGYDQYRNSDGSPKFVQREVQTSYIPNIGTTGGRMQTGNLTVKTIVLENLFDPASYPYVASFYEEQVRAAIGSGRADKMFRIYYQDNAPHGAFPDPVDGAAEAALSTKVANVGGILHQTLLDLAAWVERDVTPLKSSRYSLDSMNQISLPNSASARHGLQPVVDLTANGSVRAETGVGEPVTLTAAAEMPDNAGKIVQYAWYLGMPDGKFEPTVKVQPQTKHQIGRVVRFSTPGTYSITLRVNGQRNGLAGLDEPTLLQNISRVQVIVR